MNSTSKFRLSNAVLIGPEVNLVAITKHKKFSGYSRCSRPLKRFSCLLANIKFDVVGFVKVTSLQRRNKNLCIKFWCKYKKHAVCLLNNNGKTC